MNLSNEVDILRAVYNKLQRRRPPANNYYDVFSGSRGNQARGCFTRLAKELQSKNINPKKFIVIMSSWGHYEYSSKLPLPSFLCSAKAFEVYAWLSVNRQRRYLDEDQMMKGVIVGLEANSEEVLGAIKECRQQIRKIKGDRFNPAVVFALRDGLKPWYLALHRNFLQSEYFEMLDKNERKEIKACRSFYKLHPAVKQKALVEANLD